MIESIFKTITALVTIQALIFGLVFILNSKKSKPLVLLGIFLFIYSGTSITWMLKTNFPSFFTSIKYIPIVFSYSIMPLFYIYVKSVINRFDKKDFFHIIPAIIEFLLGLVLFIFPNTGDAFYSVDNKQFLLIYMVFIPPLYNMIYAIITIKYVVKQQKLIPNYFTDIEKKRVNWLIITCLIFITEYLLEIISSVVQLNTKIDTLMYVFQVFSSGFIVYWISIYGLTQKVLSIEDFVNKNGEVKNKLDAENLITENENLVEKDKPNPETSENFEKIITFFVETKIYTNKDVNLFMVSGLLQIPYKELSRMINTYGQKNFNQFVNTFRIQEAKRMLDDADFDKFNFSGIAEAVGFNSRSSFFTNFKQIEGITPLEYKRSLEHRERS
jgi:AraC-like DNA-binding protein